MSHEHIDPERLNAMLQYAHKQCRAEDCERRLENRALVLKLDNARRISILRCWGGDL